LFASWPFERGKWRLGQLLAPWLVTRLDTGPWIRVSGVSEFEWRAIRGESAGETGTLAAFSGLLRDGGIVIDVGANIGFYTLTAAIDVGIAGRVVAFEPNAGAAARLRENIAINRLTNVTVAQSAVGARDGTITFHLATDSEASSVYAGGDDVATTVTVPIVSLDRYLAAAGIGHVDVLKIDAEGAELDVLGGARELLSQPDAPSIIVEANPVTLRAADRSTADLRALLLESGYTVSCIETMRWRGEIVENWLAQKHQRAPLTH
jgi:FkbM family methyltransferase